MFNFRKLLWLVTSDCVVYQPGKVGSTTIASALRGAGLSAAHVHSLVSDSVYLKISKAIRLNTLSPYIFKFFLKLMYLRKKRKVDVFVVFREPTSRAFSAFSHYLESNIEEYCRSEENWLKRRSTKDDFLYECLLGTTNIRGQEDWINYELSGLLDIRSIDWASIKSDDVVSVDMRYFRVHLFKAEIEPKKIGELVTSLYGKDISLEAFVDKKNSTDELWFSDYFYGFKKCKKDILNNKIYNKCTRITRLYREFD